MNFDVEKIQIEFSDIYITNIVRKTAISGGLFLVINTIL